MDKNEGVGHATSLNHKEHDPDMGMKERHAQARNFWSELWQQGDEFQPIRVLKHLPPITGNQVHKTLRLMAKSNKTLGPMVGTH